MRTVSRGERGARERLLDAADALFYADGIHAVGIDRVIARAGVAKASLYSNFGSKEELVRAYLERRSEQRRALVADRIEQLETPREKILGIFDVVGELARRPDYRGCAFLNAAGEGASEGKPGSVVLQHRKWVRELFTSLARESGATAPETLGRRLQILHDGALSGSGVEHDPSIAAEARAMAEALLRSAKAK